MDARTSESEARSGGSLKAQSVEVNVLTHHMQRFAVWFGGSVLSSTPDFYNITRRRTPRRSTKNTGPTSAAPTPSSAAFEKRARAFNNAHTNHGTRARGPLCHGVAGNAYALLAHWRASRNERSLRRARCFAGWAATHLAPLQRQPDRPHSLYEGPTCKT